MSAKKTAAESRSATKPVAKPAKTASPKDEPIIPPAQCSPVENLKEDIRRHMFAFLGKDITRASIHDYYKAVAYTMRERMAEHWIRTQRSYYDESAKRVYYLSLEFLVGRSLKNNVLCLGMEDQVREALTQMGQDYEEISETEWDAGLGNGGLGRLASCYLDSLATLNIPAYGYGIRYEYGIFHQSIQDGWQVERPDNWLRFGNPWEYDRAGYLYPVQFGGEVRTYTDDQNRLRAVWEGGEKVMAMAYDMMVPGYENGNVINMRLWSAKSSRDFDLEFFNSGAYLRAIEDKAKSENISKVLYPTDNFVEGQELRLKQQYFFVAATFQDITRRHLKHHQGFEDLPKLVAVQLNDTHPAIAIPELMRILLDDHLLPWDKAWEICVGTFAYTNHTVMPEALEHWPVDLMARVLPRHMQIIFEINRRFLDEVRKLYPGDDDRLSRLSLIGEDFGKRVRMANLAVLGSHSVNGVSALHSEILKASTFRDFAELFPERFNNKTNGITPRRWLRQCNPGLTSLIAEAIGPGFITKLERLEDLKPFAKDSEFRARWAKVKHRNKQRLAEYVLHKIDRKLDPDSLFDVQVKRIHEYKRQLLNVLHVISLYDDLRSGKLGHDIVPRTVLFGGKAAPGYRMAKLIIRLIHAVSDTIAREPKCNGLLNVAFLQNYCVSNAEKIIPGTELSEQISLAGTEASGTGNMKFALNGALTIGTLDGANIEIRERVGEDNFFLFGMTTPEVNELKARGYNPWEFYSKDDSLHRVLDLLASGHFSPLQPDLFRPIVDTLLHDGDRWMLLADFRSYVNAQKDVAKLYRSGDLWVEKSILNTAGMGYFSSDRAIAEYAKDIWGVEV
ncbi:MAG TPA: glycogen/starch/alpha-glucan phosphorylase [Humidesulfovibrio sp.]|uniref:glycogen/starch/alpha-glucan phosphorylase n=1 Tax=Humidesulfovibrio sp. TaxID=2910988 RepID=UPI002C16FD30|nr:glycogen/starch/alpha-glucan phosphorylase [Humidesulfovibrio sp.]HWR02962.1 glycogen/starch/alpha-glucan phosphorylase [Humidesulfovibrio sp.]